MAKSSSTSKKAAGKTNVFTPMSIVVTFAGTGTVEKEGSEHKGKPLYKYRISNDTEPLILETFKAEKGIDPEYSTFTTMYKYKSGELDSQIVLIREQSLDGKVYWNEDRSLINFVDQDPELKREIKLAEVAKLRAQMKAKVDAITQAQASPVKKLTAKKVVKGHGLEDPFAES